MSETICRKLLVTGHVQGVSYRRWLCSEAGTLGIKGWVRNRHDGSVEALLVGRAAAVEALTAWARRGPPAARVDAVICSDRPVGEDEALHGFEQRPTI